MLIGSISTASQRATRPIRRSCTRIGDAGFILACSSSVARWLARFIDVRNSRVLMPQLAGQSLHHRRHALIGLSAPAESRRNFHFMCGCLRHGRPDSISALIPRPPWSRLGVYMVARSNALFVLAPKSMV